uniref:Uncharacterized protein n=1 Tax=Parascaris equorum TaxID=6256 RepID=A0A914RKB2_PAREQ
MTIASVPSLLFKMCPCVCAFMATIISRVRHLAAHSQHFRLLGSAK